MLHRFGGLGGNSSGGRAQQRIAINGMTDGAVSRMPPPALQSLLPYPLCIAVAVLRLQAGATLAEKNLDKKV